MPQHARRFHRCTPRRGLPDCATGKTSSLAPYKPPSRCSAPDIPRQWAPKPGRRGVLQADSLASFGSLHREGVLSVTTRTRRSMPHAARTLEPSAGRFLPAGVLGVVARGCCGGASLCPPPPKHSSARFCSRHSCSSPPHTATSTATNADVTARRRNRRPGKTRRRSAALQRAVGNRFFGRARMDVASSGTRSGGLKQ